MRASLRNPDVRALFLAALKDHGVLQRAAAAAGVSSNQALRFRRGDSGFAAACAEAIAGHAPARTRTVVLTARRRARFLAALAETGNVTRACAAAGVSRTAMIVRRRTDDALAAAWADARNMAIDRVEDALFDAALGGFSRTDADGRVVRTQQAAAMFRLLARRERGGTGGVRVVELTPAVVEAARAKFDRQLRIAAETGTVPDYVALLPPPTVTAE